MATKADLYKALSTKCGFEVVQETPSEKRIRLVGRLQKDRWPFFLPVLHKLMIQARNSDWTVDISKHYFLSEDRVRFGWRIIFESQDIQKSFEDITNTILSAPSPSRVEITSIDLPGHKPGVMRGGVNARGKGATGVFETNTGLAAIQRLSRGGQ